MKHPQLAACLLILLGAASPGVRAGPRAGAVELGPFAGVSGFDGDLDLQDSSNSGLRVGYFFTPQFELEGEFTFSRTDTRFTFPEEEVDVSAAVLSLVVNFSGGRGAIYTPYSVFGVGALRADLPGSREANALVYHVGGGIRFFLHRNVALRLDSRGVILSGADEEIAPFGENVQFNEEITFGLTFVLGG